jgi:hypothetical protein
MRIPFGLALLMVSLLSLQGCNSKSSVPASVSVDTVVPTRHAFTVDSMESLRYDQTMYLADSALDKSGTTPVLKALLKSPIDLVAFKKDKGGCNSSGIQDATPLYHPQKRGFYLHYFAFPLFYEHGLSAVVYRSGKSIGNFMEDRDELVYFFAQMPDPELGEANFIRKTIDEIEAALGGAHLRNGAFLYYADNQQHLLTLCVGKGNTVLWWKWMWLSYNVKAYKDIPQEARNSQGW